MKVLIKLGGTLLDDAAQAARFGTAISCERPSNVNWSWCMAAASRSLVFWKKRGVMSRFVGGLRVSDETVIDAVTKVIAGSINKQLVAALCAAGGSAVGLSGVDGLLTLALPVNPELQFVGKPQRTDGKLLNVLVQAGYVPTVACIAADAQGNIYNVNADQMAVSCAVGWGADKLFFLTDVPG